MEPDIAGTAKIILDQYSKAASGDEYQSEREEKAELRKRIELKRAQCSDWQRFLSGLYILKNGNQSGDESPCVKSAISRQNCDVVNAMMEKRKAQLNNIASSTKLPLPDFLKLNQAKKEESKLKETVCFQEQVIVTLRNSRGLQQLEHLKEEANIAHQSLDSIDRAIQLALEKSSKDAEQMLQDFTELAIQIGEEQERYEQNKAQLKAIAQHRETLNGERAFSRVGAIARTEKNDTNCLVAIDITDCNEQQKEGEQNKQKTRLCLSEPDDEFPIGLVFKNPNDFPEILNRFNSPHGYETMVKDIEEYSCKDAREQPKGGKENERSARARKSKPVRFATPEVQTRNQDTGSPSTPANPSLAKRQKMQFEGNGQKINLKNDLVTFGVTSTDASLLVDVGIDEKANRQLTEPTAHETTTNDVKGQPMKKRTSSTGQRDPVERIRENFVSERPRQLAKRDVGNAASNGTPASTTVRRQSSVLETAANLPHQKRASTAGTTARTTAEQWNPAVQIESLKISPNVETLKSSVNQQKAVPVKQQAAVDKPTTMQQRYETPQPEACNPQHISKKRCIVPTRQTRTSTPELPYATTRPNTRSSKMHTKHQDAPAYRASGDRAREENAGTDVDESCMLQTVETVLSQSSLDFGMQSLSSEFDVNLSPELQNNNVSDVDIELDFLMNDKPAAATKADTKKKGGNADIFDFDFGAPNSSENMDQEDTDFF